MPYPDQPVVGIADQCSDQPVLVRHDRKVELWSLKKDLAHFLQVRNTPTATPHVILSFKTVASCEPSLSFIGRPQEY